MEEKKQLSIGLFEENLEWLVLLDALLTHAGHAVSVCREGGERLRTWLSTCSQPFGPSGLPPYDLLIIDSANGEILANEEVYAHLEQIVWQKIPPLIVLTAGTHHCLEGFKAHGSVAVLPFRDAEQAARLFQIIEHLTGVASPFSLTFLLHVQQWLDEQSQEALAAQQAWLDQRRVWLDQRHEWLEQRQSWLDQRRAWLEQRRTEPACQHEWLEEQHEWLDQQDREVRLQQSRVNDLEQWLRRSQKVLDQQRQPHLREAQ